MNEGYSIAIEWCIGDVKRMANEMGKTVSIRNCIRVLQLVETKHDASVGIHWGVIEDAINQIEAVNKATQPLMEESVYRYGITSEDH